ncbi:hypothetical protein [Nocardia asteroides]|uniref:hypothetical protein n=1 Tax=Nocardia asteroides TaxID=1824 RepID=UPI001E2D67EB|nr:hypothetical protein [Nocardia asteroides]UGT54401.1 hypothetical protein LTT85_27805 [Nocardia asteroides]
MTQSYENDKLPDAYDAHKEAEVSAPPLPHPANFAPPITHQQPSYPNQHFADPRFVQPHPAVPHPAYRQAYQPPQPVMPVVNVTQNNLGGGYVQVRRGPNHGLHLTLTILSCGLWAPVWILVWVIDAMGRK